MKKLFMFMFVLVSAVVMVACSAKKKDYTFSFNMEQKVGIGESVKIEMNMEDGMTLSGFTFRSDDESVLKVEGSYLTGVSEGIASVYASYDGSDEVELLVSVVGIKNMTYNLDGGTCEGLKSKVYKDETYVLPTPTKEGYIFLGWYSNTSYSGDAITEINSKSNVTTLYAYFRSENYTITYCLFTDGKEARTTDETKFESSYTLKDPEYDTSTYVFSGWYLDNNYYNKVTSFDASYNQDVKVYGLLVTKTNTITVKYNTNGGAVSGGNSATVAPGTTSLATPTRTGYTFLGWYKDAKFEYAVDAVYKNITIYAKWDENVPVDAVNIVCEEPSVKKHETLNLSYTLNPTSPTVTGVYYKSSDTSILTVDTEGLVSALKVGKATITVISKSQTGASATIEIEVYEADYFEVSYDTNSYVLVGDSIKLNAVAHLRGKENPELTWKSSDENIAIVENGVVKGVSEGFVTVTASVKGQEDFNYQFGVTVYSNDTSDLIKQIIEWNNSNILVVYDLGIGAGTPVYYMDIISSVNKLMFNYDYQIDRQYEATQAAISSNHAGTMKSIEFITVHYTGNMAAGATAKANANYFASGGNGTSIHYVTGNDGIFSCLDDTLAGWHAGDGHAAEGNEMEWYPTGIAYKDTDPIYPTWGISSDSTYTLNGVDTKIAVPTGSTAATAKVTDSKWINKMGFAYTIIDGQYYMGKTWWCYTQVGEGRLCNKGGNFNSIGIESAVNKGSDLWYTWQVTAQLVARLMIEHNLPIQRVVGHHFYTAKNCPQPMLENNLQLWWEFIELVKAEYAMLTTYKDYTYTMELVGENPNATINGRVTTTTNEYQTITYKVTVTDKKGKSQSVTLSSIVPGNYIL